MELYCEAIGNPIPEIQWWFEGNDPNETYAQLWDGARQDRVKINATYNLHSTSTISITNLTADDSGMYECRASNDPDRNHLSKSPKVKWIRSQANVFVIEREWPPRGLGTCSDTGVLSLLPCSPLCTCVPWLPKAPPHPPTPAVELRDSHPLSISPTTCDLTRNGPAQKGLWLPNQFALRQNPRAFSGAKEPGTFCFIPESLRALVLAAELSLDSVVDSAPTTTDQRPFPAARPAPTPSSSPAFELASVLVAQTVGGKTNLAFEV